jgi:large subunit ribosomal protein L3
MIGLLGKKLGMTHVYDDYGRRMAVTAVRAGPCTVLGLRSQKPHGYTAVQLGFEPLPESRARKPQLGQCKPIGAGPFRHVREFRVPASGTRHGSSEGRAADAGGLAVGAQLTVEMFQPYELVDVTGLSIGKGFQGGVRRWGWKGGPQTHGSMSHRAPGSIGSTTTPGRVWRGHHLPGHMGRRRVTTQNVRIVRVDAPNHLLLIQGSVPGSEQGIVLIRRSVKRPGLLRKPQEFAVIVEEDENLSKTAKAASKKLKAPAPK